MRWSGVLYQLSRLWLINAISMCGSSSASSPVRSFNKLLYSCVDMLVTPINQYVVAGVR